MTAQLTLMKAEAETGWRALPPLVNEALVGKFFYWNYQLCQGMRYGNELYTLFQSYPLADRLKACDVGCEHQARGIEVCITVTKTTYSVWLNLRSLSQVSQESSEQAPS